MLQKKKDSLFPSTTLGDKSGLNIGLLKSNRRGVWAHLRERPHADVLHTRHNMRRLPYLPAAWRTHRASGTTVSIDPAGSRWRGLSRSLPYHSLPGRSVLFPLSCTYKLPTVHTRLVAHYPACIQRSSARPIPGLPRCARQQGAAFALSNPSCTRRVTNRLALHERYLAAIRTRERRRTGGPGFGTSTCVATPPPTVKFENVVFRAQRHEAADLFCRLS
jgi:hypothetical protein